MSLTATGSVTRKTTVKPCIVIPAYGDPHEWAPRLEKCLEAVRRHEPDTDIILVRDGESYEAWQRYPFAGTTVTVFHEANRYHTQGKRNLNMSGILLAMACEFLSPCFVMTIDCILRAPIPWDTFKGYDLMVGEDPGHRKYQIEPGANIEEYNVATIWFGVPGPGELFLHLWEKYGDKPQCEWWEQVIWSLAYERYSRTKGVYPRELNWSHWWMPGGNCPAEPAGQIIVEHYHGDSGKPKFEEATL
jgi:hypothetical protein